MQAFSVEVRPLSADLQLHVVYLPEEVCLNVQLALREVSLKLRLLPVDNFVEVVQPFEL